MYTYKDAVALSRSVGSQWEHFDLSDIVLYEIYSKYIRCYVVVTNSFTGLDQVVDMEYYRIAKNGSTETVKEWLVAMANKPLQTVKELPDASLASARYANAIMHGYDIQLAKAGFPYPEQMPVTELTDLVVTRPSYKTDVNLLKTHCLMSVNGFFHRTDAAQDKAYVLDGGRTAAKMRCSHTGILSFLDIGAIKQIRIKPEHIRPLTEETPLANSLILTVPEDMTDKSLMLVLGGYIVRPEDNVLYPFSPNEWVLNIKGLPYFERIMESEPLLDLSSLKIEHLDNNIDDAYVKDQLLQDDTILAYLGLSQSFFVIVDTPELFYNKINVRVSDLPGLITSYQDPTFPLIMGYGRHIEYSKLFESDMWALRVADAWYVQYAWQTAPLRDVPVMTNQWRTWHPYSRTNGYLMEIIGKKKR